MSMNSRGYICWLLDEAGRQSLLESVPAQFATVVCHHVTLHFDVSSDTALPPPKVGYVVGEIIDKGVQAVVVEIDGNTIRPDGERFHVTVSLDDGRFPEQARHLVRRGWFPLDARVPLTLTPAFIQRE
jgi:hypothetical protein